LEITKIFGEHSVLERQLCLVHQEAGDILKVTVCRVLCTNVALLREEEKKPHPRRMTSKI
jgi:hypothetical protein